MALPTTLPFIFYHGTPAVSADVPNKWPCSLGGHNLMIDIEGKGLYQSDRWKHESIQITRTQADASDQPAEHTLSPQGFWRRAQDSWHHGAGITFRDRGGTGGASSVNTTDPIFRFRSSKGIDVWSYWQMSLLADTQSVLASANQNLHLAVAGNRLYTTDGTNVRYTTDMATWVTMTGVVGTPNSIATDGFNLWWSTGTSGVSATNNTIGNATAYVTGTVSGPVGYVKGRLMVANNNAIYNVIAAGALPTALFTNGNTDFKWVGFASGQSAIMAAGFSGDKSLIYKIPIKTDGTGLDAPIVAGELPDGEVVRTIGDYLGTILIGTDRGCRYATEDTNGNLTIGSVIPTHNAVQCFEGQGPYVWFGWTNYDSTSSGLGRLDLRVMTETLETGAAVPAYASDVMATAQGAVFSVATFLDKRVFTVAGSGVWTESTNLVASGTLDTGLIGFGIPDPKLAISINLIYKPVTALTNEFLGIDDTPITLDTENTLSADFPVEFAQAERFELRLTLDRDSDDHTLGPAITRWTLKVSPGAIDGPSEIITAPFFLHDVVDINGREEHLDVKKERDFIKFLRESQTRVVYQEAESSYDVLVMDYIWLPYEFSISHTTGGFGTANGTMVTQLKRLN